jgi:hypothetical protein
MPDNPLSSGGVTPLGSGDSLRSLQEMLTRAQCLVDAPRPASGQSLAWYVDAFYVGDLTAIAAAALRACASN